MRKLHFVDPSRPCYAKVPTEIILCVILDMKFANQFSQKDFVFTPELDG